MKWGQEIAASVLGILIGGGLMVGVGYAFKALQPHTGAEIAQPVQSLPAPHLLIEAIEGSLTYRASSINLQDGSPLQRAIMAEQTRQMSAAVSAAKSDSNPPELIDVVYTRTAKAGPVSSILRTERTTHRDGSEDVSYAASLINEIAGPDFDLGELFVSDRKAIQRLDQAVCEAVQDARQMRIGRSNKATCKRAEKFSFLNGAPAVFIRSDQPNTIGGIRFYFEAGRIGREKEGSYIISLPQSDFAFAVRPEYRGLFGGAPPELE